MHTYTLTQAIKMNNDSVAFLHLKHTKTCTQSMWEILLLFYCHCTHIYWLVLGVEWDCLWPFQKWSLLYFSSFIISKCPHFPQHLLYTCYAYNTTFMSYNGPFECVSVNKRRGKESLLQCIFIPFSFKDFFFLYLTVSGERQETGRERWGYDMQQGSHSYTAVSVCICICQNYLNVQDSFTSLHTMAECLMQAHNEWMLLATHEPLYPDTVIIACLCLLYIP